MRSFALNIRGKLLNVREPVIMGILNITPDSFSDGGKYKSEKEILAQAEKMMQEGASIIDIGGMSTRPGAEEVPESLELERVIPAIRYIRKSFPESIISIDTYRSRVAEAAIDAGAAIVNDISAGRFDPEMFYVAARHDCPMILMHMQGKPATMQQNPKYENILPEIFDFFTDRIMEARRAGVKDIIIDPGFGFGKTPEQNYQLLKNMHIFDILSVPVLAGLSRKRMIAGLLGVEPALADNGTTAANILALLGGAAVLRVHQVQDAAEALKIWNTYKLA